MECRNAAMSGVFPRLNLPESAGLSSFAGPASLRLRSSGVGLFEDVRCWDIPGNCILRAVGVTVGASSTWFFLYAAEFSPLSCV